MECPNCKLLNPPTAELCDCGYDFSTGTLKKPLLTEKDKKFAEPLFERKKKPRWIRYLGFASFLLFLVAGLARLAETLHLTDQNLTTGFFLAAIVIGVCWIVGSCMWLAFGIRLNR